MLSSSYIWAIGLVCLLGYGLLSLTYPKRRRVRRFETRKDLSPHEIYIQFYKDSAISEETVNELWQDASRTLGISSGKLRPTDRLAIELGPVGGFPLVDLNEDFLSMMARRLRQNNRDAPLITLERIVTLHDYVLFFGTRERGQNSGHHL